MQLAWLTRVMPFMSPGTPSGPVAGRLLYCMCITVLYCRCRIPTGALLFQHVVALNNQRSLAFDTLHLYRKIADSH